MQQQLYSLAITVVLDPLSDVTIARVTPHVLTFSWTLPEVPTEWLTGDEALLDVRVNYKCQWRSLESMVSHRVATSVAKWTCGVLSG